MKTLTLIGILTTVILSPLALAELPTKDPQAASGGWSGSGGASPTPGGGDATVIVNPTALCTFSDTGNLEADRDRLLLCIEGGIGGHPDFQALRTDDVAPLDLIEVAFNRTDGEDLPDIRLHEDDPNLTVAYIHLDQGTDMMARIRGFVEDPSSPGGPIQLWINDQGQAAVQFQSGTFGTADDLTARIYHGLAEDGYDVSLDTMASPHTITVYEDPYGNAITYIKLSVDDPALVTSDIELTPLPQRIPAF